MLQLKTGFLAIVCMTAAIFSSTVAAAEQFSFVALGDTTYAIPDDYPLYISLINTINASSPAFSIHVGDTKGWGDCGDDFQLKQKDFFNSFKAPVVYALGNNEWADCWRDNRGNRDPTVVLASVRKIFFPEPSSLGMNPMPLLRQSDFDSHPVFVENARWATKEATFVTVNVIGDSNNQLLRDEHLWREFVEREKANVAWLESAFAAAEKADHKAIVIAMHSNIFIEGGEIEGGPFTAIRDAIASGAQAFSGQVLVIHGHEHTLIIDRPLRVWDNDAKTSVHDNVTRLQVYGWPDMKAVRVRVDTGTPWVFGFEPLYPVPSISPAFQD